MPTQPCAPRTPVTPQLKYPQYEVTDQAVHKRDHVFQKW